MRSSISIRKTCANVHHLFLKKVENYNGRYRRLGFQDFIPKGRKKIVESSFQMNILEPPALETVRLIKFTELKHIDFK